jgi:hypothetical protein
LSKLFDYNKCAIEEAEEKLSFVRAKKVIYWIEENSKVYGRQLTVTDYVEHDFINIHINVNIEEECTRLQEDVVNYKLNLLGL